MSESYLCAVIGNPIDHSLSPAIHHQFAEAEGIPLHYEKQLATDDNIETVVRDFFDKGGKGLNITLPFKERVFAIADEATADAKGSETSNTLWLNESHQMVADNTDGRGLVADLSQHIDLSGKRILLLGAGGAAKSVVPALLSEPISGLHIANRTVEKGVRLASNYARVTASSFGQIEGAFDILINATSCSLFQKTLPISPHIFQHTFCYDMAYQKGETVFVQQALSDGAGEAIQGLGMLVHQAAFAFEDWFNVMPAVQPVLNKLQLSLQ